MLHERFETTWNDGGEARPKKVRYLLVLHEHPLFFANDGFECRVQTAIDDWLDGKGKKGCDEGLLSSFSLVLKNVYFAFRTVCSLPSSALLATVDLRRSFR